jgi:hypothetical protein
MPYPPSPRSSGVTVSYGSAPSDQSSIASAGAPGAAAASGRSSAGTTSVGSRSGARTSRVSRSVIAVGR